MTAPEPFAYPATPHAPAHAPAGYADHTGYKPWLRDDFAFRCAYCLSREAWSSAEPRHAGFGADHVTPQSLAPELANVYANLVYSCNSCNSWRQDAALALDPLRAALGDHLHLDAAAVVAATPEGQDFIDQFRLNAPNRVKQRAHWLRILRLKRDLPDHPDLDALYRFAFGYPDDLPDLSQLQPPDGNANAGSERTSHHARRRRGELPAVY